MPIDTICHGCSKKLRVADEHAGKQARCPNCGAVYTVPQPNSGPGLVVESPAPSADYWPPGTGPAAATARRETPAGGLYANPPAKAPTLDYPSAQQYAERWFLKIDDGREFGPVDRPTLEQWRRDRRIGPTSQLKREFEPYWQPATTVFPDLATVPQPSPSGNPFAEQTYPSANPYQPTLAGAYVQPGAYVEPHRGGLVLALGILGWFLCSFFGLGFILGIVAWVMGAQDLAKMKSGAMDNSGYGLTMAGMILGILQVVFLVGVIGLVVVGAAFDM